MVFPADQEANLTTAPTRQALLTDAAIRIIARTGLRGLTHRAVDAEAGVPEGSTSYYFRTRLALLSATLDRLAELDRMLMLAGPHAAEVIATGQPDELSQVAGLAGGQLSLDQLAEDIAQVVTGLLTVGREQTLARFELALEASRRPELRQRLQPLSVGFYEAAASLLAAAGSADPQRHGRQLVDFLEGLLFSQLTGLPATSDREPDLQSLRLAVRDLLRGMLDR
jgi:DNA-binding transcriptional regulator YbjK